MFIYNQKNLKDLRRKLRNNSTDAERKGWNILRGKQILGLRFLRQYGVENFISDVERVKVILKDYFASRGVNIGSIPRIFAALNIGFFEYLRALLRGTFILDFYCPEIKFAVEIDGGQHNGEAEKLSDANRTSLLQSHGITVIRFWNNEIMENLEGVYWKISKIVGRLKNNPS
jgi:very-short-patch-repair endonuclease